MKMKRISFYAIVAVVLMLICGSREVCAQQLALGTDALMIGAMTPNATAELVTGEKTSLALSVAGNIKPWGMDFRSLGIRPEFKLWLSGRPMVREYIGVAGFLTSYDFSFGNKTRTGMAEGLGVTGGYLFRLTEHFCLELSGGVGMMYYSQKVYGKGDDYSQYFPGDEPARDNSSGVALVPLKCSVTFMWILR